MARSRVGLVAVAILATVLVGASWGWVAAPPPTEYSAVVTDVVDGDTVVVAFANGAHDTVRVLGVDTPETKKPNTPVQCFGPEASAHSHERLAGARVVLEVDRVMRDKYGRLLAYVWLDGRLYEDELLRLGLARLLVIAPNDLHARRLTRTMLAARSEGAGLWSAC